jgi:aldose 1-epimerase
MKTEKQFCFTDPYGKDIYLYLLRNSRGTEVVISNYGAIITSFKIKRPGGLMNDIVLGFDKIQDYTGPDYIAKYPWFGCAVGRYANRIKNAEFNLDGKRYELSKNRGDHQLHGGFEGFDKKTWDTVASGNEPVSFLELKYHSPDGEEGFPGNLDVTIRYELDEENELSYEFNATTDKPTPVNLTHHSYFNLNNGEGTINDHALKLNCSQYLQQDPDLVATGEILPVENTAFDFREYKIIGDEPTNMPEYDSSFVVDKEKNSQAIILVAELRSDKTNTMLEVWSTEPIVHFYSGKWTPVVKGKNGKPYGPFSGLCLETHKHPDAVNNPHFPNTILRPGETYRHKTIYKVKGS